MISDEQTWQKAEASLKEGAIKKVPGEVKPMGKLDHETAAFRNSIKNKTLPELKTTLAGFDSILNNKTLVSKLPDKGAKVRAKMVEIKELIAKREKATDEAAAMLKNLKINPDEMEWKHGGSLLKHLDLPKKGALDSDDDEDPVEKVPGNVESPNVFKLLACREVPPARPKSKQKEEESYATSLASKIDSIEDKDRFAPFKSSKTSKLDQTAKADIKLKHREVTKDKKAELMPLPPASYSKLKVQTVDMAESLELQRQQAERMKELQVKNAKERLTKQADHSEKMVHFEGTAESKMAYRDVIENGDDSEGEAEIENLDESQD